MDRLLHQQARAAQADLAGVLEGGAEQGVQVCAPVAVGEHQRGVLAAQFQRDLLQLRPGQSGDAPAHRGAAGERHGLDGRMQHQRFAHGRPAAVHDVQHATRQADLGRQHAQHRRGGGCDLGRFGHHGVAGGQRGRDLPGEQVERQVPRRYRGHHAQRCAQRVIEPGLAVVRFAGKLRGRMREEAQVGDRPGNLDVARQRQRLAGIARLRCREKRQPGLQRVGQPFQPAGAGAGRQCGPRRKGRFRGLDGLQHLGLAAIGDLGVDLGRRRLEDGTPGACGARFAIDEVAVAFHAH